MDALCAGAPAGRRRTELGPVTGDQATKIVPFVDLNAQYSSINEEIDTAVAASRGSCQFVPVSQAGNSRMNSLLNAGPQTQL